VSFSFVSPVHLLITIYCELWGGGFVGAGQCMSSGEEKRRAMLSRGKSRRPRPCAISYWVSSSRGVGGRTTVLVGLDPRCRVESRWGSASHCATRNTYILQQSSYHCWRTLVYFRDTRTFSRYSTIQLICQYVVVVPRQTKLQTDAK